MRSVCYSTVVPREQIIVFGKRLPERDFGDGQVAQRLFMHHACTEESLAVGVQPVIAL